ncbi:S8 family serine peptidase [Microbacterium phyllosphaerae]|uniref:S8 family serine peptidase n=1 Tax=Microbacterium phyllosphaerae TaxID=124798 RepID=UPI000EA0DA1C|nr:S8 family serine peptidase [Microbacterium phyllosphaerae]
MADHLRLSGVTPMTSKRKTNRRPGTKPFDPDEHREHVFQIFDDLEATMPGLFEDIEVEPTAEDLGEIVLKVTGSAQFTPTEFTRLKMSPLAGDEGKHFFVLTNQESRALFHELAEKYNGDPATWEDPKSWREMLEKVQNIELYGRDDRISATVVQPEGDGVETIDITLWPTSVVTQGAAKVGKQRVEALVGFIEEADPADARVEVVYSDHRDPDTLQVRATVNAQVFDMLAEHPYVERLQGPLVASVTEKDIFTGSAPTQPPLPEGTPIGIIDDLIVDANPWLHDVVVARKDFPTGHQFGSHTRHGTQVAGLAAWGDIAPLLADPDFDGQPFPLYLARVAQMNSQGRTQLVDNADKLLEQALRWLHENDVRIVVFALGRDEADTGPIPEILSSTLDRVATELRMVVVTAAGNLQDTTGHWLTDYPSYLIDAAAKVAAPGSAATAVTVGSLAHTDVLDATTAPYGQAISGVDKPAPFTRTGPLRATNAAGRQKPEFASYGGSWGWDAATNQVIRDNAGLAVPTLIPPVNGRLFGLAAGTSYAAPRVAHELARIQTRYPDASPNLLRALLALAGDQMPQGVSDPAEIMSGVFGVPSADRVLESVGNSVIFVYEGEMATNSHLAIELPIPEEFATGVSQREVRVALAFDPPTRRSRRDYVAGNMVFELIHREPLAAIQAAFAKQPTAKEREDDPALTLVPAMKGRRMTPPKTRFKSSTLICREYSNPFKGWDPDDQLYHLVITHEPSPWTQSQKNAYKKQSFAVAVQLVDRGRPQLDLFGLAEAQLQARTRGRAQGQTQ